MGFKEFERTGVFTNGIKVGDLIKNLQEYKDFYGDQPVRFSVHGEEDCFIQFDYFKNALVIYAEEEDPR